MTATTTSSTPRSSIGPEGERLATYRKIHLFDVDVGGVAYRESDTERPGAEVVVVHAVSGGERVELGLTVCYDLRFPELYRILAVRGARVLTVPAAFTAVTGRDHWEVLLRARAIENQAFVVAPGQVGDRSAALRLLGPFDDRRPLGRRPGRGLRGCEGFAAADLDLAEQERVRAELPSLANRRPGAYAWPEEVHA